jgi:hypothetical protein
VQNPFIKSLNSKPRHERLNEYFFFGLAEAQHMIEAWRQFTTVSGHIAAWVLRPSRIRQPGGAVRLNKLGNPRTAPARSKLQPRTPLTNAPTLGAGQYNRCPPGDFLRLRTAAALHSLTCAAPNGLGDAYNGFSLNRLPVDG